MRTLFVVLCLAILAGCSGSGAIVRQMDGRSPSVYIEPIPGDGYGLAGRLESLLAERGYDPVTDPAKASMRLNATYAFSAFDTRATVRLSDAQTGDNLYRGEGKNPGFGTLMNPAGAIAGCFERALSDLPRR